MKADFEGFIDPFSDYSEGHGALAKIAAKKNKEGELEVRVMVTSTVVLWEPSPALEAFKSNLLYPLRLDALKSGAGITLKRKIEGGIKREMAFHWPDELPGTPEEREAQPYIRRVKCDAKIIGYTVKLFTDCLEVGWQVQLQITEISVANLLKRLERTVGVSLENRQLDLLEQKGREMTQ